MPGATEYGAANGSYVELIAVRNAGARQTKHGVAAYETYVQQTQARRFFHARGGGHHVLTLALSLGGRYAAGA